MAELERSLGYPAILLIAITAIMGTGIYFLPAVGIAYSGPASLIAWLIMGLIAIYTSMIFAELTSMFPTSGGIYEFAKQAYGRTISFFIGWATLIVGYVTIAMLIIGAMYYLLPQESQTSWWVIAIAILFVLLLNYIAYSGLKTSATMLMTFSLLTIATITFLTFSGLIKPFPENLHHFEPFFPVSETAFVFLFLLTLFGIAETFFGWETATFLAGETKNGARVVSRALVHATVFIALISILLVIASILAIHPAIFGESTKPLFDLGVALFGEQSGSIFSILVYLSIIGSVAGWIVGAPRLILTLAQDGLFVKQFAHISPKYNTPSYAILFQTVLISIFILAGAGSYYTLLHMLVPIVLILYSSIMLTAAILRKTKPDHPRYFHAPFLPYGAYMLVIFFLSMIVFWAFLDDGAVRLLLLAGSFLLMGIPVYLLVELYNNRAFATKIKDKSAHITVFFENFFIPKHIQEEIFSYLGPVEGKTILEYGSSVGTLTQHLIYSVGRDGKVIAINDSSTELKILQDRVARPRWKSLEQLKGTLDVIHHESYTQNVHSKKMLADAIVSLDTLSLVQDPHKLLKELATLVPEGAPVCFFDFTDFFKVLPNQYWMSSERNIERVFRECGFSVHIRKRKRLFWSYVFVYGRRTSKDIVMV
ncbi:MAG: amino acid permease [Candidatus Woesearchaeota archaeon]